MCRFERVEISLAGSLSAMLVTCGTTLEFYVTFTLDRTDSEADCPQGGVNTLYYTFNVSR